MSDLVMTLQEETRLARLATLDAEAFGALYDHYFPRVYNYIRFRVPDAAVADDLTATVFTRALDRLHTYRPDRAPFGAWLFRIAHNAVADHYRVRHRRPTVSLDAAATLPAAFTPEVEVQRREEAAVMLAALAALSQREREIVALKFSAGLTNRRIAEIVGLKPGHVGVILYRAIRKLRDQLAKSDEP
ncbi:MAG: sigma-70 family RNA polymerase sigma factor [Anaerolineae bacterium]|nr:MAG: sigma-70 family RNA polymerase sigma factor [Anaerolineae bacterium]